MTSPVDPGEKIPIRDDQFRLEHLKRSSAEVERKLDIFQYVLGNLQNQYQFDFTEYFNRIKKFFLPSVKRDDYKTSKGVEIPTQRLNIRTSTFETDPIEFAKRYPQYAYPSTEFEEFAE